MLCAVAADAEVGGVARRVKPFPDGFAFGTPAVGDRIAEEQQVHAALFRLRDEAFVALEPIGVAWGGLNRGVFGKRGGQQQARQRKGQNEAAGKLLHGGWVGVSTREFNLEVTNGT